MGPRCGTSRLRLSTCVCAAKRAGTNPQAPLLHERPVRIPAISMKATSQLRRKLLLSLAGAVACLIAAAQDDSSGWVGFNPDNTIRGTVTAGGAGTFTIRTDEGAVYKVLYSVNSRIMANRGPAKAADIHTGDMLIATGNVDNAAKTVGAAVLIGVPADEVRKMREGLGKTWTAGKITAVAMDDTPRITLARLDGANQTIDVDENTSFKRHHESITMADIKAGESLRADGHLVGKTFLAETVSVFMPGERGEMPAGPAGQNKGAERP